MFGNICCRALLSLPKEWCMIEKMEEMKEKWAWVLLWNTTGSILCTFSHWRLYLWKCKLYSKSWNEGKTKRIKAENKKKKKTGNLLKYD